MNMSEVKEKLKNKEQLSYADVVELIRAAEGKVSIADRFGNRGRTRNFIKNNIDKILNSMEDKDQLELITYMPDIPEILPELNSRIANILQNNLKSSKYVDVKILQKFMEIAYSQERKEQSDAEYTQNYLKENSTELVKKLNILDYHGLYKSLESNGLEAHFIEFVKENYEEFLNELSKTSVDSMMFFNNDKKFMIDILSGKFKEFFKKAQEPGAYDMISILDDNLTYETLNESQQLREEIVGTFEEAFENKKLESSDFDLFASILEKYDSKYIYERLDNVIKILPIYRIEKYLELLERNPDSEKSLEILTKYAEAFVRKSYAPLNTFKQVANTNDKLEEKMRNSSKPLQSKVDMERLKEVLNSRSKDVAEELSGGIVEGKGRVEILEKFIHELCQNEKCDLSDISFLGSGTFSKAYQIGNKVLKLGMDHHKFSIPRNNRRFLQPIVRSEQILNGDRASYIEITELCDMTKPASGEDVYKVYKELRDQGIIWGDAKPNNLGRLIKPNKRYLDSIGEIDDNGNTVWGSQSHAGKEAGFEEENDKQDVLGPGEYVIIDLDFLFREDDKNIRNYSSSYELRYQMEKKQNKEKTVTDEER